MTRSDWHALQRLAEEGDASAAAELAGLAADDEDVETLKELAERGSEVAVTHLIELAAGDLELEEWLAARGFEDS